ncbi:hypothetical protein E4U10_002469 [Claviceps purpurea]|nr:hypothetical protein E4U10_002469 [Claviceps purpurea]
MYMEDGRAQAVEVVSTKCPKGDLDSATVCRRASAPPRCHISAEEVRTRESATMMDLDPAAKGRVRAAVTRSRKKIAEISRPKGYVPDHVKNGSYSYRWFDFLRHD